MDAPDASVTEIVFPDGGDTGNNNNPGGDDAGDPGPDPETTPLAAPPPITGGTLTITADGNTAVAADPDRDLIYIVDLTKNTLAATFKLQPGDEPGRVVEGTPGTMHVALRRGGAVVSIDTAQRMVLGRRDVCPAPRGMAWDNAAALLHIACNGGELVSMQENGKIARTVRLDRDLRDVIVEGQTLLVSRFRSAELLTVAGDGTVSSRMAPPQFSSQSVRNGSAFQPDVAWRTIHNTNGGGALMLHQRGIQTDIPTQQPGGYSAPPAQCASSLVHTTVSTLHPGQGVPQSGVLQGAVVPVDLALSPDGSQVAIVAVGNAVGSPHVLTVTLTQFNRGDCVPNGVPTQPLGAATAVAYQPNGNLVVQTREPATLFIPSNGVTVALSAISRIDPGMELFHRDAGGSLACASCHPEGGEDSRVWPFDTGKRRTQSIRGGILGTEPFHWEGDQADFNHLLDEVFTKRMTGPKLDPKQQYQMAQWVNTIPLLPGSPAVDPAAVQRGQALFQSTDVACNKCHNGDHLTNNQTVDVGTSGMFQVPSLLGVAGRAPFMHNGCAPTLRDRFGGCGGGDMHGTTSKLTAAQVDDLVAYLESL